MAPVVLPDEIGLQVFKQLGRPDLKNARLVCKIWALFAAESLFDKLYISPREEDIKVFESITQHPQIRRFVKNLEYDATYFSKDLDGFQYFLSLSTHTHNLQDFKPGLYDAFKKEDSDPQVADFLNGYNADTDRFNMGIMRSAYERCKDYDFITEGHRKWHECAMYQDNCIRSGDFDRILRFGLRNLDCLESLYVTNDWWPRIFNPLHPHHYDSPFGRKWSILRATPHAWTQEFSMLRLDESALNDRPNGFDDFWRITTALAHVKKRVRRLGTKNLSPVVFDQKHSMEDRAKSSIDTYSSLQVLDLYFFEDFYEAMDRPDSDKLSGLQNIIGTATRLQQLRLTFVTNSRLGSIILPFAQIFPDKGSWLALTSLSLCSTSTSAKNLVRLLTVRTPGLIRLELSNFLLSQGRWEGVIETLKRSTHLLKLRVWPGWWLQHSNYLTFMGENEDAMKRYEGVEHYISGGSRHPSLLPDEPDSASEKYLSDLWL